MIIVIVIKDKSRNKAYIWIYFLLLLFKLSFCLNCPFVNSIVVKTKLRCQWQYHFFLHFQDLKVKKKVRLMISSSKTCFSSTWLKFSFPLVSGESRKIDREKGWRRHWIRTFTPSVTYPKYKFVDTQFMSGSGRSVRQR